MVYVVLFPDLRMGKLFAGSGVCRSQRSPFFVPSPQEESGQQRSLSVLAVESPEWRGSLPLGPSSDNYTMLIKGGYTGSCSVDFFSSMFVFLATGESCVVFAGNTRDGHFVADWIGEYH